MKPEQALWALVRPYIPGHVERVENVANTGTPDVVFCFQGVTTWIELKVAAKTDDKMEDLLRPEQKVWHLKHVTNRGNVFVLFRVGAQLTLYRAGWPTKDQPTICTYIVVWTDVKNWDWRMFEANLRSY